VKISRVEDTLDFRA